MQNAPLPSLNATLSTSATKAAKVSANPGVRNNDAFKQAFSQQLEQRQTVKNAEARAAERQAGAKPARQDQPIDRSAQPKPAEHASRTGNANEKDEAQDSNERAASDAQAAHGADPVADMLALVAAFNQRAEAGKTDADPALAASGGDAAGADAATLAALTAAEAATGTAPAPAADTDVKAAPGRDTLPAASAEGDADSNLVPLRAELAGHAGPARHLQGAAGIDPAAGTVARPDPQRTPATELAPKVEAGSFGQQLAGARANANDATEAALAASETAPATLAAASPATGATAPEAKVATPATTLYSRVGTPAWDQQLGQKVIFMAAGGEHSATMELNPPDLGPLQVVLSVNKDQATAAFTSAAPEVRQALEAAMPRLREMMGEAGIALGNATVSSGAEQQAAGQRASNSGSNDSSHRGSSGRGGVAGDDGVDVVRTVTTRQLPNGAVDTFA